MYVKQLIAYRQQCFLWVGVLDIGVVGVVEDPHVIQAHVAAHALGIGGGAALLLHPEVVNAAQLVIFMGLVTNLYQPMYSPDISGTCVIVNVWYPGLIQNALYPRPRFRSLPSNSVSSS